MRNLCKLSLASIHEDNFISPEARRHLITGFTPQLLKLECLQKLHLETVPFLEGHLHQLLGSMRTPLDDLAVTHCTLLVSEWNCHSEFPRVSQWQQVNSENVRLTYLSTVPLCILLVKTSPTLVVLDLEDRHIYAILPALSNCPQLTKFSFYGNQISMYARRNSYTTLAALDTKGWSCTQPLRRAMPTVVLSTWKTCTNIVMSLQRC